MAKKTISLNWKDNEIINQLLAQSVIRPLKPRKAHINTKGQSDPITPALLSCSSSRALSLSLLTHSDLLSPSMTTQNNPQCACSTLPIMTGILPLPPYTHTHTLLFIYCAVCVVIQQILLAYFCYPPVVNDKN